MMKRALLFVSFGACASVQMAQAAPTSALAKALPKVQYNRDVRPILSENCFSCHGFDKNQRKAGLRLDVREDALAAKAFVPGKPEVSELVKRIFTNNADELMPPGDSHKSLTAEQKQILKRWVAEGAEYQPHWAFIAPVKAPVPKPKNAKLARNVIDNFILERLEKSGLRFAPETSREVLLRRVTFDLTGLPPTPAEVDAFLADKAPNAYDKVVDRLLASPRYGEHMAVYWLDAVRYADTHGLHFDNERHIWPYRDWVVKAFNDNKPFDQFTIEQLAGDLLPNSTREQKVATGYNRCAPTSNEGGSIAEELLYRYSVDRTETTASVFLGLTAGCAACHDHKFDPVSQKDFYQLYAFFNSGADPAMDGNQPRTPPILKLSTPEQEAQLVAWDNEIGQTRAKIKEAVAKLDYQDPALQTPPPAEQKVETIWMEDAFPESEAVFANGHPQTFISKESGPVFSGERSLKRTDAGLSQDVFERLKTPFTVPTNGILFTYVYLDPQNPPKSVMLQWNTGTWSHRANWGDADAIPYGEKNTVEKIQMGELPKAGEWVRLEVPVEKLKLAAGVKFQGMAFTQFGGTVYWDKAGVIYDANPASDPNLSLTAWTNKLGTKDPGNTFPQDVRDIFKKKPEERNDDQKARLREYYLSEVFSGGRETITPLKNLVTDLESKKKKLDGEIAATMIWADTPQPRKAFVMLRGQYDKPGEEVQPGTPAFLPALKKESNETRATRLDLARWMVAPEQPLTARVFVNRLWQQAFGTGLVKTSADFGAQGQTPSHPELLDWLAVDFRESGWDIKRLMKLIVSSAAYRQESKLSPRLRELDPENRLIARGPRLRLDAEAIRDNALFTSGLINLTMGGRGARPYQPINIWEPLAYPGSDTDKYVPDKGSGLYRRSLYTFWKRTAPQPAIIAFDAPTREAFCTRRERSNTPMQALVLMNDVQHFEAARGLATRILKEGGKSSDERLAFGFRIVTARRPTAKELEILRGSLAKQLAHYKANPDAAKKALTVGESKPAEGIDPTEYAAWTMVSNLLLNLDETVTKN